MNFKPRPKTASDPLNETPECGLEWWEWSFLATNNPGANPGLHYDKSAVGTWKDGLTYPDNQDQPMFDDWFNKQRPECQDKKGKPLTVKFTVDIGPDTPGITTGSGSDRQQGYIGIKLKETPGCGCNPTSSRFGISINTGKGYAKSRLLQCTGWFPATSTPPPPPAMPVGNPPGW